MTNHPILDRGKLPARVCAWCGKGLGLKPEEEERRMAQGFPVTHGICDPCAEALEREEPTTRDKRT